MALCDALQGCKQCPMSASPCWLSLGLQGHMCHTACSLAALCPGAMVVAEGMDGTGMTAEEEVMTGMAISS